MRIDDLLCTEYKAAKRTNLLNDESQMLPLMDLENSEALINLDGSYYKPELGVEDCNDVMEPLVEKHICIAHVEAIHASERPRISLEQMGKILATMNTYQHRRAF